MGPLGCLTSASDSFLFDGRNQNFDLTAKFIAQEAVIDGKGGGLLGLSRVRVESPFTSYEALDWSAYGYDFYYDSSEAWDLYYDPGAGEPEYDFRELGF